MELFLDQVDCLTEAELSATLAQLDEKSTNGSHAILRTSKQICSEIIPELYRNLTICICSALHRHQASAIHLCHENGEHLSCWPDGDGKVVKTPLTDRRAFITTDNGCSLRDLSGIDFSMFQTVNVNIWLSPTRMLHEHLRKWSYEEVNTVARIMEGYQIESEDARIRKLNIAIGSQNIPNYALSDSSLYGWLLPFSPVYLISGWRTEIKLHRRWVLDDNPPMDFGELYSRFTRDSQDGYHPRVDYMNVLWAALTGSRDC